MKLIDSCLVFLLIIFHVSYSWDLKSLNIENPMIRDVKVYGRRAFISLKISGNSPTLLEASWPDNGSTWRPKVHPYPSAFLHTRLSCAHLYDVISIDIDKLGLLWVLDVGGMGCPPKVVLISLMTGRVVKKIWIQMDHLRGANVTTLCVDAQPVFPQAYIGTDSNTLLICSQLENACFKRNLFIRRQNESDLEEFLNLEQDIQASALAIEDSKRTLFLTSHNKMAVFSVNLEALEAGKPDGKANNIEVHNMSSQLCRKRQPYICAREIQIAVTIVSLVFALSSDVPETHLEVDYVGDTLAPLGLLLKDANSGFVYTSQRDYAILKWDTNQPLRAESHDVLLQSYQGVSCLSALFQAWGQLWGVSSCGGHCEGQCTHQHNGQAILTTTSDTST